MNIPSVQNISPGRDSHRSNFHRPDCIDQTLYVITPVFNPQRFRSRWKLYKNFEKYVLESNQAHLITIECSFGERDFVIEEQVGKKHTVIRVQTDSEIWFKENLINIAVTRLPLDWKYMAWIDADVVLTRPDWVGETLHQLQHYKVLQMWSEFQDVTPDYEVIGTARSFMDCYIHGRKDKDPFPYYNKRVGYPGAPGLAWAMRRDAWQALGGLIDVAILGACDWYMAHALVGNLKLVLSEKYHPRYREIMFEWEKRAEKYIQRNVGVMKGLCIHYWHGSKSNRKYGSREQILIRNQFNPDIDLKKDWQGLYQLTDRSIELRDQIKKYFRERNEDQVL